MLNNINSILSLSHIDKEGKKLDASDIIEKYNKKGYYISFTNLDKIGIYPQSNFETPLGIYAYNIPKAVQKYNIIFHEKELDPNTWFERDYEILRKFPFANTAKYINILKIKDDVKLLNIHNINKEKYNNFISILEEKVGKEKVSDIINNLSEYMYLYCDDIDTSDVKKALKTYAGRLWNIIRFCSVSNLSLNVDKRREHLDERKKKIYNPDSLAWNKFLRNLGYDGVDDWGRGIIHPNEPQQTVFLSSSAFEVIDRFDNSYHTRNKHIADRIKTRPNVFENNNFNKIKKEGLFKLTFNNCNIKVNESDNLKAIHSTKFNNCNIEINKKIIINNVSIYDTILNGTKSKGVYKINYIFSVIKNSTINNSSISLGMDIDFDNSKLNNCDFYIENFPTQTIITNSIFSNCDFFSNNGKLKLLFKSCVFNDNTIFSDNNVFDEIKNITLENCYWNISKELTYKMENIYKKIHFKNCFIEIGSRYYNLNTNPIDVYENLNKNNKNN